MKGEIMSNKAYREAEGISRSELYVLFSKSPLHMKYAMEDTEEEDSLALLEGRAAHKLILEPEEFFEEFAIAPKVDRRTKEGKEAYNSFVEEAQGKEIITDDSFTKIKAMAEALKQNEIACSYLKGDHERSFFWTDSITGERCKCRPDCLATIFGKKYIVDYKTTDSCADGAFERSVKKFGYKFQAGMYREGVFNNTFEEYGFVFVAQEKKPPYASRVYVCTDEFIREGYEQFRQAVDIYHFCKKEHNFYGYADTMLFGEEDYS